MYRWSKSVLICCGSRLSSLTGGRLVRVLRYGLRLLLVALVQLANKSRRGPTAVDLQAARVEQFTPIEGH